jgi:hypothetical protein
MDKEILEIIEKTSSGKLKYMEKQAKKHNFDSVYDYLLDTKNKKEKLQALNNAKVHKKDIETIIKRIRANKTLGDGDLSKLLKSYGGLNPFDLKVGDENKPDDFLSFPILVNLRLLLSEILGLSSPDSLGGTHLQKSFPSNEHHLKNDEMFWSVLPLFWCVSNAGITDETFNRYDRQKVSLEKRVEAGIRLEKSMSTTTTSYSFSHQLERINSWTDEEIIAPIFRTFRVSAGKSVRKSVIKDDPNGHIHDEGSSWSYSLQKSCAANFIIFNRHLVKKYGEFETDEEVDRCMNQIFEGDDTINIYDATLYDGFYQCIGLFGVEKKNIQFLTDRMGEDELVANPKDVKLLDYRFANILDVLASEVTKTFLGTYALNNASTLGVQPNRSSFLGADGFFDLYRIGIKKFLDENPTYLKPLIRNWNTQYGQFPTDVHQKVTELCGDSVWFAPQKIGDDLVVRLSIGGVPLARFNDGIRQRTSIPKKYIQH